MKRLAFTFVAAIFVAQAQIATTEDSAIRTALDRAFVLLQNREVASVLISEPGATQEDTLARLREAQAVRAQILSQADEPWSEKSPPVFSVRSLSIANPDHAFACVSLVRYGSAAAQLGAYTMRLSKFVGRWGLSSISQAAGSECATPGALPTAAPVPDKK